jgi:phosphoribosylformylglycinamidine synthase
MAEAVKMVKVIILRTGGTNCDYETKYAFEHVGSSAELVHVNELIRKEKSLSDYQIMAIPGGFTYGDDIASGKILASELKYKLIDDLKKFITQGKLMIGICNGFQVLVKSGILPGIKEDKEATLTVNDSAKFEDRWIYLSKRKTNCVWTRDLDETIYLPVAHAEGKFIPRDKQILKSLYDNGQVVFCYTDEKGNSAGYPCNPNGSVDDIAGICDKTGKIFGLMPHPERHILPLHHPRWTRQKRKKEGDGCAIFRNGVDYAKKNL